MASATASRSSPRSWLVISTSGEGLWGHAQVVHLGGDVVEDQRLLGRAVTGDAGPEDREQVGVAGPQLLDGEVAAEHRPARTERVHSRLDDRSPFVELAPPQER